MIKENYKVNEKFVFEDYKMEISDRYEILNVEDALLIKIPVKIKNNDKKRPFRSERYNVFNPDNSYNNIIGHIFENSLENIGYLNPNEEVTKYIYLTYEEDGDYTIEFENTRHIVEITININK